MRLKLVTQTLSLSLSLSHTHTHIHFVFTALMDHSIQSAGNVPLRQEIPGSEPRLIMSNGKTIIEYRVQMAEQRRQ